MNPTLPKHVAIVMDGNGRWAIKRGRPRVFGHVRGSKQVKQIVRAASEMGIQALTLYAFSTENWGRPETERAVLWKLLRKYFLRELKELMRENVQLHIIGELSRLDLQTQEILKHARETLLGNTGLKLTFALSYGSRREISQAAAQFARDCLEGKTSPSALDNELVFDRYLSTSNLGTLSDVDLLIRTSGEVRVSNFLLWQLAYSEMIFVEKCWPDFDQKDFKEALEEFKKRRRRFGGLALEDVQEEFDFNESKK